MTDLTSNNLQTICRLCLRQRDMVPIRETIVEGLEVFYLIEYSISLEVRNDDLMPSNVCNSCLADLYIIYGFKRRCHDNDQKLRLLVENIEEVIKIEILESDNEDLGNIKLDDKKAETIVSKRRSFWCSTCNQGFNTFQESVVHKRQERHAQFAPVCCKICDKTYERRRLATHIKTHHTDKSASRRIVSNNGRTSKEQFKCPTCNQCFTSAQESLDHKKRERHGKYLRVFCEICGKMYEKAKRSMHLEICQFRMKYKCCICNVRFNSKANLKRHLRVHTGEKEFMCSICGERFTRNESLTNHEKRHKISLGTYQCTLCSQIFNRKSFIRKHMKVFHPIKDSQALKSLYPRQFSCKECGKSFRLKKTLQVHERLHTGERPYKCDFCEFRCRQSSQIILHKRVHTGEKPYSCQICSKRFAAKPNMKSHMRIHTGEKPYKCTDCGKVYSHSNSLKKHKASHLSVEVIDTEANENVEEEEDYNDIKNVKIDSLYQLGEDKSDIVL